QGYATTHCSTTEPFHVFPSRTLAEVYEAEEQRYQRVWYERKLVLLNRPGHDPQKNLQAARRSSGACSRPSRRAWKRDSPGRIRLTVGGSTASFRRCAGSSATNGACSTPEPPVRWSKPGWDGSKVAAPGPMAGSPGHPEDRSLRLAAL